MPVLIVASSRRVALPVDSPIRHLHWHLAGVLLISLLANAIMNYPIFFFVASALLIGLLGEAFINLNRPWVAPAIMVYITTGAWYYADLFVAPASYDHLPIELLDLGYGQVAFFLIVFRLSVPEVTKIICSVGDPVIAVRRSCNVSPESLLPIVATGWLILLIIGTTRMGGDIIATLFPIDARLGLTMWQRAASDAGAMGFLVSSATYLYTLLSGLFGVILFLTRNPVTRLLAGGLWALALPYFLLSGTRSTFLAALMPGVLCFVLFSRIRPIPKTIFLIITLVALSFTLRLVVSFRNIGFRGMFNSEQRVEMLEDVTEHQGLNMIEELCFVNGAVYMDAIELAYGGRYIQELLNVVPRAIWPDKPLIGIDYSRWRGFTDDTGERDIGVFATISTGFIGGGVLNFGRILGPIAPALILAAWCGLLARWWVQRASPLRACLFLAGLGLTFNLGRDLTLLVAWPIVFGYVFTLIMERLGPGAHQALSGPFKPDRLHTTHGAGA